MTLVPCFSNKLKSTNPTTAERIKINATQSGLKPGTPVTAEATEATSKIGINASQPYNKQK